MPHRPFTGGEFALVTRAAPGYQRFTTVLWSTVMLAITLIALYLVAMAALNVFDFGRVD